MNTPPQPGMTLDPLRDPHLDPDQLSAFLEGALPEPERLAALRHMGECADCRSVVFLAQAADPAFIQQEHQLKTAPTVGVRTPLRWFSGSFGLLWTAALACCVAGILLFQFHGRSRPQPTPNVATVRPPEPSPLPPAVSTPTPVQAGSRGVAAHPSRFRGASVAPRHPIHASPAMQDAAAAFDLHGNDSLATDSSALAPPAALSKARAAQPNTLTQLSRLHGAAGLASSAPAIALPPTEQIQTQAAAPMQRRREAAPRPLVQPQSPAALDQTANANVTVTDAAATIMEPLPLPAQTVQTTTLTPATTSAANRSAQTVDLSREHSIAAETPKDGLPSRLDSKTSIAGPRFRLELDTAGHLYWRRKGKHWKLIHPRWPGAILRVELTAGSHVQLTTTAGAVWTSTDGRHWTPRNP